jgi:hypothetical protein
LLSSDVCRKPPLSGPCWGVGLEGRN